MSCKRYPRFTRLGPVEFVSDLDEAGRDQFVALMNHWGLGAIVTRPIYRWRLERSSSGSDDLDVWFFGAGHGALLRAGTTEIVGRVERYEMVGDDRDLERGLRQAQLTTHRRAPKYDNEIYLAP